LSTIDFLGVKCKLSPKGDGRKFKKLPLNCYPDCNKRAEGCPLEKLEKEQNES